MSKISLNDIESRLGRSSRPTPQFDEYGYENPVRKQAAVAGFEDDDDQNTLSAGFIATCVAIFVAVGGGTFFFMGGELDVRSLTTWKKNGVYADYVSKVDAKCGQGWGNDRENRDQLYCYMTTKVDRLCDPNEKGHFLNTMQRFTDAAALHSTKLMGETMKMVGNQGKMMQFGMAGAQASQQGLSEEEQMEAMERVANLGDELMGGFEDQARKSVNNHSMDDLGKAMGNLISKGYITREDFGWTAPQWVENAIKAAKPAGQSACREG